jgi:cytidine deaminase
VKPTARTPAWAEAINCFADHMRPDIDSIWENRGVLSAERVAQLGIRQEELGTLMMQLLPVARQYAVVPLSDYQVGAVAAGMPNPVTGWCSLYLGANFELEKAALTFTTHAEQAAVNNAWLNGEEGVQALAISAAPCGYCRQFLNELVTAKRLKILQRNANNLHGYRSWASRVA